MSRRTASRVPHFLSGLCLSGLCLTAVLTGAPASHAADPPPAVPTTPPAAPATGEDFSTKPSGGMTGLGDDAISVTIPLFYYTNAAEVLRILRPDAQVLNKPFYNQATQAVLDARRAQQSAEDAKRGSDNALITARERQGQAAQALSQAQQDAQQDHAAALAAQVNQLGLQQQQTGLTGQASALATQIAATTDPAKLADLKAQQAALSDKTNTLAQAQAVAADDVTQRQAADKAAQASLTSQQADAKTAQDALASAQSDIDKDATALAASQNDVETKTLALQQAESTLSSTSLKMIAPPTSDPGDPFQHVYMRTEDATTIFLRGRPADVAQVRQAIRRIDTPIPQARVTLWTIQINGQDSATHRNKTTNLQQTVSNVEDQMAVLQTQLDTITGLFRDCLQSEVDKARTQPAVGYPQFVTGDPLRTSYLFYDPTLLTQFDTLTVPGDPASFVYKTRYSLAYRNVTDYVRDPYHINSLGQILLVMLLADEAHRQAVLKSVLKQAPEVMARIEWQAEMHEEAQKSRDPALRIYSKDPMGVPASHMDALTRLYRHSGLMTKMLAAFGYQVKWDPQAKDPVVNRPLDSQEQLTGHVDENGRLLDTQGHLLLRKLGEDKYVESNDVVVDDPATYVDDSGMLVDNHGDPILYRLSDDRRADKPAGGAGSGPQDTIERAQAYVGDVIAGLVSDEDRKAILDNFGAVADRAQFLQVQSDRLDAQDAADAAAAAAKGAAAAQAPLTAAKQAVADAQTALAAAAQPVTDAKSKLAEAQQELIVLQHERAAVSPRAPERLTYDTRVEAQQADVDGLKTALAQAKAAQKADATAVTAKQKLVAAADAKVQAASSGAKQVANTLAVEKAATESRRQALFHTVLAQVSQILPIDYSAADAQAIAATNKALQKAQDAAIKPDSDATKADQYATDAAKDAANKAKTAAAAAALARKTGSAKDAKAADLAAAASKAAANNADKQADKARDDDAKAVADLAVQDAQTAADLAVKDDNDDKQAGADAQTADTQAKISKDAAAAQARAAQLADAVVATDMASKHDAASDTAKANKAHAAAQDDAHAAAQDAADAAAKTAAKIADDAKVADDQTALGTLDDVKAEVARKVAAFFQGVTAGTGGASPPNRFPNAPQPPTGQWLFADQEYQKGQKGAAAKAAAAKDAAAPTATQPVTTPAAPVPDDSLAASLKTFADDLRTRNYTDNSLAIGDQLVRGFVVAVEDDLDAALIHPRLNLLQAAASDRSVDLGIVTRTSVLAGDRHEARVDPRAEIEYGFPQPANLMKETLALATLVVKGAGTAAGGGLPAAVTSLVGSNPKGLLGGLQDLASQPATPAPEQIYKVDTGNEFVLTPILLPDAQNVAFNLDYTANSPIREPQDTGGRHLAQIERHGLHTFVEDNSFEVRELSRFESRTELTQPVIRGGGIPLLRELPGLRDVPLIGWFTRTNGHGNGLQESLIYVHTVQYPTVRSLLTVF